MILLLENKDNRQTNLDINFSNNEGCIDNILGDNDCNKKLNEFLDNSGNFDKYDTIIIHSSIYTDAQRSNLFDKLSKYCQNKNLIKFSGSDESVVSIENHNTLTLGPKRLYQNLQFFLEHYYNNPNILMLAYGIQWELNIFLNSLEKINLFLENNSKKPLNKSIFSSKTGLTKIKDINEEFYTYLFEHIESNNIDIDQIKRLKNKIVDHIKEKSYE